jgi:hypothetical protein
VAFGLLVPALIARIAGPRAGPIVDRRIARRLRIDAIADAIVAFDRRGDGG